jgi:hypothetical protein
VSTRRGPIAHHVTLPLVLLTVALLGGMRVAASDHGFVFVPPPLVALLMATLLVVLLWRGELLGPHLSPLSDDGMAGVSNALTLLALFFASAQAFNSVLPEQGVFHWLFAAFLLWTLWTSLFLPFDAARLVRSLAALLGTAFVLKHMVLQGLNAPPSTWSGKLAALVLEGLSLGALQAPAFAPATGYISFFTVALYVLGLMLAAPVPEPPAVALVVARDEP